MHPITHQAAKAAQLLCTPSQAAILMYPVTADAARAATMVTDAAATTFPQQDFNTFLEVQLQI